MLKEVPKLVSKAIFAVIFTKILGPLGIPVGWMLSEYLTESLGTTSEEFFKKLGEETGLLAAESPSGIFGLLKGNADLINKSVSDFSLVRLLAKSWEERLNHLIISKDFDDEEFKKQTKLLKKWRDKFAEAQDENKLYVIYEIFPKETSADFDIQQKAFETITNQTDAENNLWANLKKTLEKWTDEDEKDIFKTLENDVRKALTENLQDEILVHLKDNQTFQDSFQTIFEFFVTEQLKKQGKTGEDTNKIVKQHSKKLNEILNLLKNQPNQSKPDFKGFHKSFPRVPEYFTGRIEVLEQLEATLETENQASFYGTHGLGKTRTAIEYAKRHKKEFDFVLFISATKGNFVNNAAFVGAEISKEIENATTLEAKYDLLSEYLQNRANWLIIVDNVEDVAEVIGKIPKHFAGKVIYTSNSREIRNAATLIPIEAMTQTEAELTLLRRKLENNKAKLADISDEEQTAITKIVEKIGTLPIGLNLAGAFANKFQRNFREYLKDYEAFEDETFKRFRPCRLL